MQKFTASVLHIHRLNNTRNGSPRMRLTLQEQETGNIRVHETVPNSLSAYAYVQGHAFTFKLDHRNRVY